VRPLPSYPTKSEARKIYQLAAFFGQLKHKGQALHAISGELNHLVRPGGEVKHPVTDKVKPKPRWPRRHNSIPKIHAKRSRLG